MKTALAIGVLSALALSATACSVATRDPDPPVVVASPTEPAAVNGTATIDWTIDGTTDGNRCSQSVSQSIRIAVYYQDNGQSAGVYEQSCATFATSITLGAGRYNATAELVDSADAPRTTQVSIAPFTILGNDNLAIPIDFSASSFF